MSKKNIKKNPNGIDNFYTKPDLQEHLVDGVFDDNVSKETGIALNTVNIISGGTGSGKTNAFLNFLKRSPNVFDKVCVFNNGIEDPLYSFLEDKFEDVVEINHLDDLPDLDELDKPSDETWAMVFDDFVGILGGKDKKNSRLLETKLNNYAVAGRKKKITMFYISQSFYTVPLMVRENTRNLLLCKSYDNKDMKIFTRYAYPNLDKEVVMKLYNDSTENKNKESKDPGGFLLIHTTEPDIDKRYRKGFGEYYKLRKGAQGKYYWFDPSGTEDDQIEEIKMGSKRKHEGVSKKESSLKKNIKDHEDKI